MTTEELIRQLQRISHWKPSMEVLIWDELEYVYHNIDTIKKVKGVDGEMFVSINETDDEANKN
jgi:hypothetical protein